MKKSVAYKMAQIAVAESQMMVCEKLDVLKILFADESLALFTESQEEKANEGV